MTNTTVSDQAAAGLGTFERLLSLWVALAIVVTPFGLPSALAIIRVPLIGICMLQRGISSAFSAVQQNF